MLVEAKNVNFIGVTPKNFTNAKGEEVNYLVATLVHGEDIFTPTVSSNHSVEDLEPGVGTAALDISSRNGKLKLRLIDFLKND